MFKATGLRIHVAAALVASLQLTGCSGAPPARDSGIPDGGMNTGSDGGMDGGANDAGTGIDFDLAEFEEL